MQVNLCQKLLFLHQLTAIWQQIVHGNVMKTTSACNFHGNSMTNLLSYCVLVDATISASEKDWPVHKYLKSLSQIPAYCVFTIKWLLHQKKYLSRTRKLFKFVVLLRFWCLYQWDAGKANGSSVKKVITHIVHS